MNYLDSQRKKCEPHDEWIIEIHAHKVLRDIDTCAKNKFSWFQEIMHGLLIQRQTSNYCQPVR
jgi:hypothetical protein